MGAWSVSITGNDTAADLRSEYAIAFCYHDVETALQKIDAYARQLFQEGEEPDWQDYLYSLADFMWKKGILTDAVRDQAIAMIDSGQGLSIYAESGPKILEKRQQVLSDFRQKLLSPQPPRKKIRVDLHTKPIFDVGDLITFPLQTAGKPYLEKCPVSEEQFRALDGKYVVWQKVSDDISFTSAIDPTIHDIWPEFVQYNAVFDAPPTVEDLCGVEYAAYKDGSTLFFSDGKLAPYKRRRVQVIGQIPVDVSAVIRSRYVLGIHFFERPWYNPDTEILKYLYPQK